MFDDYIHLEKSKAIFDPRDVSIIEIDKPFDGYILITMKNKTELTIKGEDAANLKKDILKLA